MISLLRSGIAGRRLSGSKTKAFAVVAALSAGGCSADIARFDFPSANLNETSTGTIPTPAENVGGRSNLGADPAPEPAAVAGYESAPAEPAAKAVPDQRINVTALPPPPAATPSYATPPRTPVAPLAAAPIAPEEKGEEIEVKRGDTLYGLSQRHKVSLNELMRVNGLTSPSLKPGQKLVLPSGKTVAWAPAPVAAPTIAAAPAPADWTGTYTVKTGDSLYGIARQNKVKLDDLQRYNGIADVRRVRPGVVLKIPGIAGAALAEAPAATTTPMTASPATTAPAPALTPPPAAPVTADAATAPVAPSATPTILNSQRPAEEPKVAALQPETKTDATTPGAPASGSVADTGKLRWPVKGRVIAGFGQRTDGTHNDGINISVPQGADVHAAEGGNVAYAGSELKGYGNLVLIRHDNGWVTAYAHADELLVKRGDKVTRGQVIAKAGKTGQVDQPQLHFEVRQGQKPVDPTPFMEKL